ncbi:MAG: hypothetical protein II951_01710 [Bacteroidales bacterium]|nr:hypothetical protein [Bacteroidales bacterium]
MKIVNAIFALVSIIILLLILNNLTIGVSLDSNNTIRAVGGVDRQGNRNGTWVYFHESNPSLLCNYTHGVAEGACAYICSGDTPRIERMYEMKDDTLRGFIYTYRNDGHIKRVTHVKNYLLVHEFEYDHDTISFQNKWWGPEPAESATIRAYNDRLNNSIMYIAQPMLVKLLLCILLVQLFTNVLWVVISSILKREERR